MKKLCETDHWSYLNDFDAFVVKHPPAVALTEDPQSPFHAPFLFLFIRTQRITLTPNHFRITTTQHSDEGT